MARAPWGVNPMGQRRGDGFSGQKWGRGTGFKKNWRRDAGGDWAGCSSGVWWGKGG
ncbi:MAG: hypothetical protein ABSG14_06195 [Verrucomicrobiia bacterium]